MKQDTPDLLSKEGQEELKNNNEELVGFLPKVITQDSLTSNKSKTNLLQGLSASLIIIIFYMLNGIAAIYYLYHTYYFIFKFRWV